MAGIFVFDTLQYVKKLKEAGVGEKAAEVQAEAIKEMIDNNLATKGDIYDLKRDIETTRSDLKRDIETVRSDLKRDIEIVRSDLKRDIEVIKKDLTIRMGGMLSVAIGVIGVLITLVDRLH